MVNHMAEVAKMLGVELGEEFEVGLCHVKYVLTEDGLLSVNTKRQAPYILSCILNGTTTIHCKTSDEKEDSVCYAGSIGVYGCSCCSIQCERKNTCALYDGNITNQAILVVENYYNYGIGSINANESEVLWWCGPHGDWGMYRPLEEE